MDLRDIRQYIDDRPGEGVFRVHRDVFSDPELFELEQQCIFERTWNFLALESQLAKPHDFVSTFIGRTPVLVTRGAQGKIGAFLNVCRHKGAVVCRAEQGSAKYHVCPYHGWAYDSSGKNVDVKDRKHGLYAAAFDAEDHNLVPLARLAAYKGMIFGSLSAEAPELEEFLGDMRFFLDLAMDQGPNGMEFIPGRVIYTYHGNWKLQMDNGLDAYHLTSTHTSFIDVQGRRRAGQGNLAARSTDWAKRAASAAGAFTFPFGHALLWSEQPEPQKRPTYQTLGEIRARVGDARTDWIMKLRNLLVFPNMQIAEAIAPILRTFRPIAVDRTEMRSYCLAPVGEAPELRAWRIRQFEDFFNPGGLATPDDTTVYEECQRGFPAKHFGFLQGYARGIGALEDGANDLARTLGIRPAASLHGRFEAFNEVGFHAPYREWARLMQAGLAGRAPQ